jgi:hypothetical protein
MSAIVTSSHLAIGLFALWFLYFVCWREHRIDTYRQRLFEVRDDLFDFAASGAIKFSDPAYVTLRDLSNGLIRFGHRLNFTRIVAIALFGGIPDSSRMQAWEVDVKTRPAAVRDKLLKAHAEIRKASLWHVLAWSPLAWVCTLVTIAIGILRVRVKITVVRVPRDIPTVLEAEALEQSSLPEEEGCLATV